MKLVDAARPASLSLAATQADVFGNSFDSSFLSVFLGGLVPTIPAIYTLQDNATKCPLPSSNGPRGGEGGCGRRSGARG